MTKCIAFHSYKGGTGKTTIASNFAVLLARKGYRVFLMDLDVYAPSLQAYFEKEPVKWINDFFWNNAQVDDVLVDLTHTIDDNNNDAPPINGKMYVGFCNPKKRKSISLMVGGNKIIRKYSYFEDLYFCESR